MWFIPVNRRLTPLRLVLLTALLFCLAHVALPSVNLTEWSPQRACSQPGTRPYNFFSGCSSRQRPPPHHVPYLDPDAPLDNEVLPHPMNGKFPDSELAEALHANSGDTTHLRHNNAWRSIDELRDVVSRTNGYFVRGYSLYLGWNNMRHIIEAGLQQAKLLNRTLVLPSYVYARGCEYDPSVCARYTRMVKKSVLLDGRDRWDAEHEWDPDDLPHERQLRWRVPLGSMLNLTHLYESHTVMLVSEFLRLHGHEHNTDLHEHEHEQRDLLFDDDELADAEHPTGHFRMSYLERPSIITGRKPTCFVIENTWYDGASSQHRPSSHDTDSVDSNTDRIHEVPFINRVDFIPADMKTRGGYTGGRFNVQFGPLASWESAPVTEVAKRLVDALPVAYTALDWDHVRTVLRPWIREENDVVDEDAYIERLLQENGWEVLYTFDSNLHTQSVVRPTRQAVPRASIRGLVDDYAKYTQDVVILAGETHRFRKPGQMRFSTPDARDKFAYVALHDMRHTDAVISLAETFAQRMYEHVDGRAWMGAHMRRDDFLRTGWAHKPSPLAHVEDVAEHLDIGRALLHGIKFKCDWNDVKDCRRYYTISTGLRSSHSSHEPLREPPAAGDAFYVATDEREPYALREIRRAGALLFEDLLTHEDEQAFGWPLLLTDVRGVVEQEILAHAALFYGRAMSAVTDGVVALRATHDCDPRTVWLE